MRLKFHGAVRNGKFVPDNVSMFVGWFKSYEGKRMTVIAGDYFNPRTEQENKYYWAVIVTYLSEFLGMEKEEVHAMLKTRFLSYRLYKKVNECMVEIEGVKSTKSLSIKEFEDYVEAIRRWVAQSPEEGGLDFRLPDPNQLDFNN